MSNLTVNYITSSHMSLQWSCQPLTHAHTNFALAWQVKANKQFYTIQTNPKLHSLCSNVHHVYWVLTRPQNYLTLSPVISESNITTTNPKLNATLGGAPRWLNQVEKQDMSVHTNTNPTSQIIRRRRHWHLALWEPSFSKLKLYFYHTQMIIQFLNNSTWQSEQIENLKSQTTTLKTYKHK